MKLAKCFDIVEMVTDEAARKFAPALHESDIRMGNFKEKCKIIEEIADAIEADGLEAEVDEETREISVSLICRELVVEDEMAKFGELVKGAKRCDMRVFGDRDVRITFVFEGIWV